MYDRCPCCQNPTFPVPPQQAIAYICPVCWWENDVFVDGEDVPSDENHGLTLKQGRENFYKYGICDPRLAGKIGNRGWRDVVRMYAQGAKTFEIHCWKEETDWINLAMDYGAVKETEFSNMVVIRGEITPAFLEMLLTMEKPQDTEIYDKMTPFFSIFFDNGFSSEHYGTELYFGPQGD